MDRPRISGDASIVTDAALAGAGLAYLFEDQIASLLETGARVRVLEDWCAPIPGFFLHYPGRRQVSPALAAFIAAIRLPTNARKGR